MKLRFLCKFKSELDLELTAVRLYYSLIFRIEVLIKSFNSLDNGKTKSSVAMRFNIVIDWTPVRYRVLVFSRVFASQAIS